MGSHLSCISCKNEKENSSENKPKKKKEVQTQSSSSSHATATSPNAKYCPVTSGWELYQILRSKNGVFKKDEEEEKLSDVEKVAQAIVEINVYLASQVIYPAIQRYLQEIRQNEVDGKKDEIKQKISS